MLVDVAQLAGGLAILTLAAEAFVTGAARLSHILKLPLVIIGAVVIGFGTSAPELVVSVLAAIQGDLDISVGNIAGSNIANLSLVLGAAAALAHITISSSVLRFQAPLSLGAVVLFAVTVPGGITRIEGGILLVSLTLALTLMIVRGRIEGPGELAGEVEEFLTDDLVARKEIARTLAGLVATLGASHIVVSGATGIALTFGWSTGVVGLTIVAVGTSLPELATTVIAARNDETDLIVGNLLGSNIFNSLAVGGVAGTLAPGVLSDPAIASRAIILMVAICGLATLRMQVRPVLGRPTGLVLLTAFVASLIFLTQ